MKNDCYFRMAYKAFASESDVTKPGYNLDKYKHYLAQWVESTYYDNDRVFFLTMCFYQAAFLKKETTKMMFKIDKGGDGKGGEAMAERALFGDENYSALDFGIFTDREEFRTLRHVNVL